MRAPWPLTRNTRRPHVSVAALAAVAVFSLSALVIARLVLLALGGIDAPEGDPSHAVSWPQSLSWLLGAAALSAIAWALYPERASLADLQEPAERRQAMREVSTLRMLQALTESSPDAIVAMDPRGRYVLLNAAAARMLGVPAARALGRRPHDVVEAALAARIELRDRRVADQGAAECCQEEIDTAAGRRIYLTTVTPSRDADGALTGGVYAISRDITAQREREIELQRLQRSVEQSAEAIVIARLAQERQQLVDEAARRTAELEHARHSATGAAAAKSEFVAGLVHEIRTPMGSVVGLAELLAQTPLSPHQADLVRNIRETSDALLALVNDLLDFSRIETGHLELEQTTVALRPLVEGACDALQPYAAARGVLLHVFVDPALPAEILLDTLRWRQILNNLVSNAIKFSAGLALPGRVRVQVDGAGSSGLRLVVTDNGIGMTAEAQTRIFSPFAQAEISTMRRYGGTGLGLSIVKRLVDAFGGSIDVQSTPDEGSRFTVCVPITSTAAAPAGNTLDDTLRGVEVLVCVNDTEIATDWGRYLTAAGAQVAYPHDIPALLHLLDARARTAADTQPVALIGIDTGSEPAASLGHRLAAHGAGLLRIGRGHRRGPRRDVTGATLLDADTLHRSALVDTVAQVAGRTRAGSSTATAPTAPTAAAPERPPTPVRPQARVLVAEDNLVNQEIIRQQLALLGVEIEVVGDGETAFARWQAGGHALLLTDVHMPGISGCELVERIRAHEGTQARLPIVALTAAAVHDETTRCRDAGVDDVLCKPASLEQLAQMLQRWLPPTTTTREEGSPA